MTRTPTANSPAGSSPPSPPTPAPARWWLAPLGLVVLFYAAAGPLILSGRMLGRAGGDQINYHEPTIRQFARELPTPDLSNYLSATTPGYHLLLAVPVRVGLESSRGLQLLASLITAGLLAILGGACARRAGPLRGFVPCLPVLCSMYVFMPGVWLLPDGAGWLGVLALMLLALDGRPGARTLMLGSAVLVALILVRQVHLWAACLVWAAAWLGTRGARCDRISDVLAPTPARFRAAGLAILATLPAILVVVAFVRLWGGLTPPRFHEQYHGLNPAAPAFVLALLGGFGPFFMGSLLRRAADGQASNRARWQFALALLAGIVVAVIPETSRDLGAGRSSGLWNLAARLPLIAGRTSPLIAVLSGVGAAVVLLWCRALGARDRWITLACLAGFTAAEAASFMLFQRYAEPMILILLAVLSARVVEPAAPRLRPIPWPLQALPVVLAVVLAGATAWKLWSSMDAVVSDVLPGRQPEVAPSP